MKLTGNASNSQECEARTCTGNEACAYHSRPASDPWAWLWWCGEALVFHKMQHQSEPDALQSSQGCECRQRILQRAILSLGIRVMRLAYPWEEVDLRRKRIQGAETQGTTESQQHVGESVLGRERIISKKQLHHMLPSLEIAWLRRASLSHAYQKLKISANTQSIERKLWLNNLNVLDCTIESDPTMCHSE